MTGSFGLLSLEILIALTIAGGAQRRGAYSANKTEVSFSKVYWHEAQNKPMVLFSCAYITTDRKSFKTRRPHDRLWWFFKVFHMQRLKRSDEETVVK